jgi:nucleoside-diphosphate-sugar epimerase
VELLAEAGVSVRALVRRTSDTTRLEALGIERVEGALDDAPSLRRAAAGVDVVFHLAALTRARNAAEYARANVEGARRVAEAAGAAGARLVYLSSLAAVGPSTGRPVAESDEPRPITDYGRSKLAGEIACRSAAGDGEVVVLRAPAVYGPRDRDLFRFFSMAAWGIVALPTGPERRLQLIHVRDLAAALLAAARAERPGPIYNVAEARSYAWSEVASMVAGAVGGKVRFVRVSPALVRAAAAASELGARLMGRATIFNRDKARELLAPGWLCETAAAERDLAFVARIPLAGGLQQTADWYRSEGWL